MSFQHETTVGRIAELLAECDTSQLGIAVIEVFGVATTRHERFRMPYLIRGQPNPSFIIVHTKVFSIAINTLCINNNLDCSGY